MNSTCFREHVERVHPFMLCDLHSAFNMLVGWVGRSVPTVVLQTRTTFRPLLKMAENTIMVAYENFWRVVNAKGDEVRPR